MVEGHKLAGRYLIQERIAVGGMGGVYLAHDEKLDRRVAIKVLKEDLAQDPRFVERFRREARAVAALSHPNVATVYDYGEDAQGSFIVMEFVEGRDLARVLREDGPLEPERAARIGSGMAKALAHAHAAGVIHRDVKPANAIISGGDRVQVTDFGIARAVGESTLTATGSVMGTAQYLSPEQASGDPVGPYSDVYSLGVVLYEMLTGAVPFSGDKAIAIAMRHVSDEVPAPSTANPNVPPVMDAIVARATQKKPANRYTDAQAMAAELDAAAVALESSDETAELEEETAGTVWPIPGSRYDPEKLGRRVIAVLGGLAVLALALLVWRIFSADPNPAGSNRRNHGGAVGSQLGSVTPTAEASSSAPAAAGFVMPGVTGSNYKDVESLFKEAGIKVKRVKQDAAASKDIILVQDPAKGTQVEEGDTVTLTVSTGKGFEENGGEEGGDARPPGLEGKAPPGHSKHGKEKGKY